MRLLRKPFWSNYVRFSPYNSLRMAEGPEWSEKKEAKRSEELIDRLGQGKVKLKLKTSQAQIIVKEQSVFVIGETLVVITEPIVQRERNGGTDAKIGSHGILMITTRDIGSDYRTDMTERNGGTDAEIGSHRISIITKRYIGTAYRTDSAEETDGKKEVI
ncbi:hypothetical protein CEXT_216421 [Caerostris extrusa]|uniref:Uncharacterized protein n=1 Tax=Caerostris extrusa TaxID=172846 RepID=A0AAV4Y477_CAEEX|nr:hypothetical protein CEXT_216421 [Caerostris extrusa]